MLRAYGFRATLAALVALSSACNFDIGFAPSNCDPLGSSCGTGPTSVPPAIRVEPVGDVGLAVGETLALTATYHDASGAPVAAVAFAWRSANPAVAEVSAAGVVQAVSVGSVLVTATALGIHDSVTVHVRPVGLVFTEVSVGDVPCGVAVGGTAYCWLTSPIAVPGGHTFTGLSSGLLRHSCAIEVGRAYCWGENDYGELGSTPVRLSRLPIAVSGGLTFATVGAGVQFSCGLTNSGAAYCWGKNDLGQLGTGSITGPTRCTSGVVCSPTPVPVVGGLTFRSLTVGGNHACGLVASGVAYCWGMNGAGELGNGTSVNSPRPVAVTGGRTFVAISAGQWHTCALTSDGAAFCWGADNWSILGTRAPVERCYISSPCSTRPVAAAEGLTFTSLSAGGLHTCGITAAGAAFCWGAYYDGPVFGTLADVPLRVEGGLRFRSVSAGNQSACGLTVGAVVYCWRTGGDSDAKLITDGIVATRVVGQ
jgi:alpha-tubulin suppressor-like RCC1 family protein